MTEPTFTVLLPVHRGPELLELSVESVLAQWRTDLELLVVCDGAPSETVAVAEEAAARDERVRVLVFEKGERHGEAHRHTALQEAKGAYVAQIADDDLWLPDHLDELGRLLERVDFGGTLFSYIDPGDTIVAVPDDLADAEVRSRMCAERYNVLSPTCAGYRLAAYRSLAEGWSPAPHDVWTDLFMWRKFLRRHDLRAETAYAVTAIHLPASLREGWTVAERRAEMARFAEAVCTKAGRAAHRAAVWKSLAQNAVDWRNRLAKCLADAQPAPLAAD